MRRFSIASRRGNRRSCPASARRSREAGGIIEAQFVEKFGRQLFLQSGSSSAASFASSAGLSERRRAHSVRSRAQSVFASFGRGVALAHGGGGLGSWPDPARSAAKVVGHDAELIEELLGLRRDPGVRIAGASKKNAGGEESSPSEIALVFQCALRECDDVVHGRAAGVVDRALRPADDVQRTVLDAGDTAIFHRDERGAFGAGFARVAALKISRKDDPRLARFQFRADMHVPERPVIVALRFQIGDGAGRVVFVAFESRRAGVEQADVQIAGDGRREGSGEIFGDRRRREAAPVDGDAEILEEMRAGCLVVGNVRTFSGRRRSLVSRLSAS